MPQPNPPAKHNDYWCVGVKLPSTDSYIVKYEPLADPKVAHHMLLYGCKKPHLTTGSWPCQGGDQICSDQTRFLFAWAKGAEGISMPEGVGFFVGPSSDHYAVMQIHYGQPSVNNADVPALSLYLTTTKQPRVAGIFLIIGADVIPPNKRVYTISSGCTFGGPNTIHPFAYRTHAHSLCKQIDGYVVKNSNWNLIGSRSPQDPQAFYPVKDSSLQVSAGDWLAARCIYNSVGQSTSISMGSTSEDEMCNFYIMYDMPNNDQGLTNSICGRAAPDSLSFPPVVPVTPVPDADSMEGGHHHGNHDSSSGDAINSTFVPSLDPVSAKGLPPKPPLDKVLLHSSTSEVAMATSLPTASLPVSPVPPLTPWTGSTGLGALPSAGTKVTSLVWAGQYSAAGGWPYSDPQKTSEAKFGQISAVAMGANGTVYILHRGTRVWDISSFSSKYTYNHVSDGPISVPTVVGISPAGEVLSSWGEGLFYLPHGLTIDYEGNYWITDVAMHQVFKFNPSNLLKPALTKGTAFMPGSGQDYFCQPAAVAVERSGMFYVADGYCNSRVVRFTKDGVWDIAWSDPVGEVPIPIRVAHSLVVLEEEKKLFLADRENGRILSYDTVTGEGRVFSDAPVFRGAMFAISFSANETWPMVAINGHTDHNSGFTINKKGAVISTWGPDKGFSQPHAIAVAPMCEVYVAEIGPNLLWKFLPVLTNTTVPDLLDPSPVVVSSYSLVLFIAIFGLSAVVISIMVAIICCFSNQRKVIGVGQNAKKTIQTLLKPNHVGFTKLQTYDSASEDELHAVSVV
eukprot:Em0009g1177a